MLASSDGGENDLLKFWEPLDAVRNQSGVGIRFEDGLLSIIEVAVAGVFIVELLLVLCKIPIKKSDLTVSGIMGGTAWAFGGHVFAVEVESEGVDATDVGQEVALEDDSLNRSAKHIMRSNGTETL